MVERRKYSRANSKIDMLFLHENNNDIIYSIKSKNICEGGLLLIYDQQIPPGTILNIGIDLHHPQVGAETVKSEVLRCIKLRDNLYAVGIEFKKITNKMKCAIANHVQENKNNDPLYDDEQYLLNNRTWDISNKS